MTEPTNGHATRSQNADLEGGTQANTAKRILPAAFEEDETWRSLRWLLLFLLSLLAGLLDPLFFYIPMINDKGMCLKPDKKLGIIAIVLRTYGDIVHSFVWLLCYEDWFRHPLKEWLLCIVKKCGCSCFWKTETGNEHNEGSVRQMASLIKETREVCAAVAVNEKSASEEKSEKSTKLRRIIEVASVLPLPQVVTFLIILRSGSPKFTDAVTLLKFSVLTQLIVRALRVYPSYKGATRHSPLLLKGRVWVGAALNLLLFVIAGHAVGAFWYLLSVGRNMDCWRSSCRHHPGCNVAYLYCHGSMGDKSFLNTTCSIDSETPPFDFGIYLDALKSHIISSHDFWLKLGYCFWWGLRNLSSLGQNLSTSAYIWEICLAISISIIGLILFSLFIGNMQMYLQSQTDRDLKEMKEIMEKRVKLKNLRKSLVKWKPFSSLSKDLRAQTILCDDPKWLQTKDVNLKSMLENISPDLSDQIKMQLCKPLLSQVFHDLPLKVPGLEPVDERPLEALCEHAKPVVFREKTLILREDNPIEKMYIIVSGDLCFYGKEDGNAGKSPQKCYDEFLGEDLLLQALNNEPTSNSVFATKTIRAVTKVEAFSITKLNVKTVRDQFRGRFYVHERKEWAKSTLQGAVNRLSKQRALDSPRQPVESNSTVAFNSHVQNGNGIERVISPRTREQHSHP